MYILGLDVGTTQVKAAVCDLSGKLLGSAAVEYPLTTGKNGEAEQDCRDWYNASVKAICIAVKDIDRSKVKAISLSTQGGSTAMLDENFDPVRPVMTWMDSRAQSEALEAEEFFGKDYLYNMSGWRKNACFDSAKLLWMRRNEPELFAKTKWFLNTHDYVVYRLCGVLACDYSNSAMRQIFDVKTLSYDKKVLEFLEISEDKLPKLVPSGVKLGNLTAQACADTGLTPETELYSGAHDQYAAAVGCGAMKNGDMLLATGTSWVINAICDKMLFSSAYIAPGIHVEKGIYGAIASIGSAGKAVQWYKDTMLSDVSFKEADLEAEKRAESAKKVCFYPFFNGIPFPVQRPDVKTTVLGLELHNDRFDVMRAAMEGACFTIKNALNSYIGAGFAPKSLIMSGGAAKSPIWRQIAASIMDVPVEIVANADACSVGAAIMAGVSSGMLESYESAGEKFNKHTAVEADSELVKLYKEKEQIWMKGYQMLKNS